MELVVRPYSSDDWEGVCRVHDAARPIEVAEYMPAEAVPAMRDAAIEDGEFYESNVYVACDAAGEVVGFIAVHGEELTWMFVATTSLSSLSSSRMTTAATSPDAVDGCRWAEHVGVDRVAVARDGAG